MKRGISNLRGKAALTVGDPLIERALDVATPPPEASDAAIRAAEGFLAAVSEAKAAQEKLAIDEAAVGTASARFKEKVAAARTREKAADTGFATIRDRLVPEIKAGRAGALELDARIFPGGSTAFSDVEGRPQVPVYDRWLVMAGHADITSSLAYAFIAAQVELFKVQHAAFTAAIREKEVAADALAAARASQRRSQATWTTAMRELIENAARIQGEDSPALQRWIRPLLDWKAAQAAARARRVRPPGAGEPAEPAPADVTGEEDGG